MYVVKNPKVVVLDVDNPHRVLNSIPTAKPFKLKGKYFVGVPHKPDEVRVLRNLGIPAPASISYHYDWPGRFKPFEHQHKTAAFLTLHRKCIVLNEIGCVDADTEYLTPSGWKRIADYTGGAVAQYWPETGSIDFVDSPEFVKLPCDDMYRIRTKYGVDQMVSREHRVLLRSANNPHKTETLSADELYARQEQWVNHIPSGRSRTRIGYTQAAIPTVFNTAGGDGLPLTDAQLRVMVAVIADSWIATTGNLCHVRLKKQRKKDRLRELLDAACIPYTYQACKPEGFHKVSFAPPVRAETFGPEFWSASAHQLRVIVDEVKHWYATIQQTKPRGRFFSNSRASADFIQYAYAACGYTARLVTYKRGRKTKYVVGASTTKRGSTQLVGTTKGRRHRAMELVPSTDGYKYCFMVPSTYLVLRRNGCIFATGNTGKTLSALWAADYLLEVGAAKKVLIMSPLSTLERVWGDAIFIGFPKRKHVVLHGTAAKRSKLLRTDADFYIINHDGFRIIADEADGMFDLIIVDEAAVLRNPSTSRFKVFNRFMRTNGHARLWLMTGTPTPNEPTDAWALAKLIDSPNVPKTYGMFKNQVMIKTGQYAWAPRPEATDIVLETLQPAVRYTRDECFDLPPTTEQRRQVKMTAEQTEAYKVMVKELVVETKQKTITAANEAIKMQKLVQIACGIAYAENGEEVQLDCKPRIAAVKEVIEEAGQKVIVFAPLTSILGMLDRELSKHWSTAVINGAVPAAKRNAIFRAFQEDADPRVLIAHPATMSHGLTLTAASTIIWYGPITSNEVYVQANGRIERVGKTQSSNVVHIQACEVEALMYSRLRKKQKMQGLLLDLIKNGSL